jgi:molecular chaperone DnaJ
MVEDDQGPFAFSSPCPSCQGRGVTIERPCGTCRGTGAETRPREVRVRIPAGVDSGQRIRLKGRGAPGRNGGPSGDLFVVCQVQPHPTFGRDGDHLTVRVPVSYAEAALGAEIPVPTLEGGAVTLRLRAGTQSGSRHRVKGRGIRAGQREGDLIVTVDVAVPTRLGDAERAAIERLAEVTEAIPR